MSDRIQLKRSDVPGRVPAAADLLVGELAVNTADGKLFIKLANGSVMEFGGGVVAIRKSQLITSSGTWIRSPNQIGDVVDVTLVGGGCSGGYSGGNVLGGWSGQFAVEAPVDIGAATSVTCTVGTGGASATGLNTAPSPGGTTSFGAYLSVLGGSTTSLIGAAPGGFTTSTTAAATAQGTDTNYALAGRLTVSGTARATGAAGLMLRTAPIQLAAFAGVMTGAQGYGAGGGAWRDASAGYQEGQNGMILVEWWEAVTP